LEKILHIFHSTIHGEITLTYKQIVVYDVPTMHKKLRKKIADILEDYGLERLQYSVFGGNLSNEEVENMVILLKKIKPETKVDIRLFLLRKSTLDCPSFITVSEASPPHPSNTTSLHKENQDVLLF